MMVFISCIAFWHGDLFLSKTAADKHTDRSQNTSSLLLFLTLAVHSTALNNGALDSSSLLNFLNGKDWRSFLLGDLRQLGFFNEQIAVHSRSTSSRYNCCICFLKVLLRWNLVSCFLCVLLVIHLRSHAPDVWYFNIANLKYTLFATIKYKCISSIPKIRKVRDKISLSCHFDYLPSHARTLYCGSKV